MPSFGAGSAAEEWSSHENVLAAGILGCGQHEASKIMFLNLMFFHVFSFSLGVLYGPEKLGWIREMFLFLTCWSLPNAGHYPGSFLLLKYGHLQALRIFQSEKYLKSFSFFIDSELLARRCTTPPSTMPNGRSVFSIWRERH